MFVVDSVIIDLPRWASTEWSAVRSNFLVERDDDDQKDFIEFESS